MEPAVPSPTAPGQKNPSNAQFVGFLSNYEVYSYLKELKDTGAGSVSAQAKNRTRKKDTHMPTLIYETLKYFEDHNSPCLSQNKEIIDNFIQRIQPYKLTKAEKLTILNSRPTKPVELQAIIEESEERLTEEQVGEIIQIVEETLPEPESSAAAAAAQQIAIKVEQQQDSD